MIKTPIQLQDLRRKIYIKAKTEQSWRFWGLYVHVCKLEVLREAYLTAKRNRGAPGLDGVSFEAIEAEGVETFLRELQEELKAHRYHPTRNRRREIPKAGSKKTRILSIPTIRDRVVQGALKLILEPIFEADFQPGSYGYRPHRTAHQAIEKVAYAIASKKTKVIDVDLRGYFDAIKHHILLKQVASRVSDKDVLRLLKLILKTTGSQGIPQGGPLSPLLSNIYANDVDRMLERAKEATRRGRYTHIEYVRWADDLVVLIDGYSRHKWLVKALYQRLGEEFAKLEVEMNEEKSQIVDLTRDGHFGFLGFDFRQVLSLAGRLRPQYVPLVKKRTALLAKLKEVFRRFQSQPIRRVIALINPILRGWCNYFSIGHSARCFRYIEQWVVRKVRRHLMRAKKRPGFGWKRWSNSFLYEKCNLHKGYHVRLGKKARPA